ncbi:MAG TPA: hypothetical protein VEG63_05180 [Candidatus Acidoferrales bacterium]|nr:hypothetical protein [Candidatus Acidoferrales bacterium]
MDRRLISKLGGSSVGEMYATAVRAPERASKFSLRAAAVLVLVAALFGFFAWRNLSSAHRLLAADVPVHPLALPRVTYEDVYPELFPMQVAVLCTATDEPPLAAVHALREMGIPFFVTRSLAQALRHRLVLLYPGVEARTFTGAELEEIRRHVEAGGSLFVFTATAGPQGALFGFREAAPSKRRHRVSFESGADAALRYLDRPEELEIRLGSDSIREIFWTVGYTPEPGATVLARFEDGTAALLRKRIGTGAIYVSGASLLDGLLRGQTNRHYEAFRNYVNAFEPAGDDWLLVLRAWYESLEPGAVRLATMPDGLRSVVLFTHDVDWENSFPPMLDYARAEAARGARSLFFIQMKYVNDANGHGYLTPANLDVLRRIYALGFPMGTHSIIHSRAFNHFELGTGRESYVNYNPRGTGANTAVGATVFGEVRVSRELLDGNVPGQHSEYFRAGHLRVPKSLPEALERCGYEFDSSFTAPDVLTNFPYALTLGLEFEQDSGLYEFPVTIEDEEEPPLIDRVNSAIEIFRANAENGAPSVVLIHPTDAKQKLEAEEAMLAGLPAGVRAIDPLEFAQFWRARDRLEWSVAPGGKPRTIELRVTSREAVRGITFAFAREIAAVSAGAALLPDRHRIVLAPLEAGRPTQLQVVFR